MTILENFQESLKTRNIIDSLEYLWQIYKDTNFNMYNQEGIKNANELLEFGDFFVDNYEESSLNERAEFYGKETDAEILLAYDNVLEILEEQDDFYTECEDILINLNTDEQRELEKVFDIINSLPGTKIITIEYEDGIDFSFEFEEKTTNDQKLGLKATIAKCLKYKSAMLIELKNSKTVAGLFFINGEALGIKPKYVKKMHKIDPITNNKLKHKGYKYIQL